MREVVIELRNGRSCMDIWERERSISVKTEDRVEVVGAIM